MQQPVHATPISQLVLDDNATLSTNGAIINIASRVMANIALEKFSVTSPEASFSGTLQVDGEFSTANIKDLGDPSAAAASLAECQAQIAEWVAEAAASAAEEEAARAADNLAAAAQDDGAAVL